MSQILITSAIILLINIAQSSALKCYNQTNMDTFLPNIGELKARTKGPACVPEKWCSRLKVDNANAESIPDVGNGISMNGTMWKCIRSEYGNQKCNRLGVGCHQMDKFDTFTGDIELCCCNTDLCNNDESLRLLGIEHSESAAVVHALSHCAMLLVVAVCSLV